MHHELDNGVVFNAYKNMETENNNIFGALSRKRRSWTFSNGKLKHFFHSGHKHNHLHEKQYNHHHEKHINHHHNHHIHQSDQNNQNHGCKHRRKRNHHCSHHSHKNYNLNGIQQTTSSSITTAGSNDNISFDLNESGEDFIGDIDIR